MVFRVVFHRRHYLAVSTDAGGERLVFVDLLVQAATCAISLTAWATAQGVPLALVQDSGNQPTPPNHNQRSPPMARRLPCATSLPRPPTGCFVRLLTLDRDKSTLVQVGQAVPIEGNQFCTDFGPTFAPDSRWIALQFDGRLQVFSVDQPGMAVVDSPGPGRPYPLAPDVGTRWERHWR